MKRTTLCFLIKDGAVLLAMKKRGFGKGKWNGVGGKVQEGENSRTTTVREAHEEIGVTISPEHLYAMGTLSFSFKDNSDWNNECDVFIARMWIGEPVESEEMRPKWYHVDKLPFNKMWIDDKEWLPQVLAGKKIAAAFTFSKDGTAILERTVGELS